MRRTALTLLVLVSLTFVACGGDDDDGDKPSAQTSSQETTPEQKQQSVPEGLGPLTSVAERLTDAGYRLDGPANLPDYASGATGVVEGALTVSIYSSRSKEDLARAKRGLTRFERDEPEQVEVSFRGERIYVGTVEAPEKLDEAQFLRILKTAEG